MGHIMSAILALALVVITAQSAGAQADSATNPGPADSAANAGHADSGDSAADSARARFVSHLVLDGAITPASAELLADAISAAADEGAEALVVELDTPGGLVDSTRDIIQAMLASRVPIVVYVAPPGARAGSAGVFITLAAHVAAMAPGTNIGAATPVTMGGGDITPGGGAPGRAPADTTESGGDSDLERKILNDTVAFIRTIAEKRGRNADWAERAVREAVSVTETQAVADSIVDLVAPTLPALLDSIDGRSIDVLDRTVTLRTAGAEVRTIEKGLRFRILETIANPNIAFVLMLIGIYGIFFELMNPGAILPGAVGGIALLLAFFALQALPVNVTGILLLLFSLVLFIAEVKVTSFGLLTVGGIIAFVLGATMLFDAPGSLMRVSWTVIVPAAVMTAAFFAFSVGLAYRTWKKPATTGREGLVGMRGVVRHRLDPEGQVDIRGEIWRARAAEAIEEGATVEVTGADGLTLDVKRA